MVETCNMHPEEIDKAEVVALIAEIHKLMGNALEALK